MKRFFTTLALALGTFATVSSAAQIQGFVSGYAPSDVDIEREANGSVANSTLKSGLVLNVGAEFLVNPIGPLVVGGGLGYVSVQQDGHDNVVVPAVPLFASIGVIGPENNVARPYFEARIGYPIPATDLKSWWNNPANYILGASIGAQLPYHMGVEINCMYLSMNQYFEKSDVNFRLSSLKFGGSVTVHFDLFKNSSASDKAATETPVVVVAPVVADPYDVGYSSEVSESSETSAYDVPYGDEQPAAEASAEPVATSTEPAYGEPVEDVAAEESAAEETVAEESSEAAEETSVEEAAAEAPAEEPMAEPAPAPEKKAAAKKAPAKKKAAKKPAKKKAAKKQAKKPAKKAPAKKKK